MECAPTSMPSGRSERRPSPSSSRRRSPPAAASQSFVATQPACDGEGHGGDAARREDRGGDGPQVLVAVVEGDERRAVRQGSAPLSPVKRAPRSMKRYPMRRMVSSWAANSAGGTEYSRSADPAGRSAIA